MQRSSTLLAAAMGIEFLVRDWLINRAEPQVLVLGHLRSANKNLSARWFASCEECVIV
jgi:hypothetical protein